MTASGLCHRDAAACPPNVASIKILRTFDVFFGTECRTRFTGTPSIVSVDSHAQRYSAGNRHSG
jgi:hypothetical protein